MPFCCRCLKIAPYENKTGLKFCSEYCLQETRDIFNCDDNREDIADVLKSFQLKCDNCDGYHWSTDTQKCPEPKRERPLTIG
jgi:hypothetical protein